MGFIGKLEEESAISFADKLLHCGSFPRSFKWLLMMIYYPKVQNLSFELLRISDDYSGNI